MINASNFTKLGQALLSWGIRLAVVGALAIVDYLIAALSHGLIHLPYPLVTAPLLGSALSESDTWLVKWEADNGVSSAQ